MISMTLDSFFNKAEEIFLYNNIDINHELDDKTINEILKNAYYLYRTEDKEKYNDYVPYIEKLITHVINSLEKAEIINFINSEIFKAIYAAYMNIGREKYFSTPEATEILGVTRQYLMKERGNEHLYGEILINTYVYEESELIRYCKRNNKDFLKLFQAYIDKRS